MCQVRDLIAELIETNQRHLIAQELEKRGLTSVDDIGKALFWAARNSVTLTQIVLAFLASKPDHQEDPYLLYYVYKAAKRATYNGSWAILDCLLAGFPAERQGLLNAALNKTYDNRASFRRLIGMGADIESIDRGFIDKIEGDREFVLELAGLVVE